MYRSICLAMLSCSAACTDVYSVDPVGRTPVTDLSGWVGVWTGDEDGCRIRIDIADAARGELRATAEPSADGDADCDDPEALSLYVRRSGDRTYVNVDADAPNDGPVDRYLWAVVEVNDSSIDLWLPTASEFRKLIDADQLPGEHHATSDGCVSTDDVTLLKLTHSDYDTLDANAVTLFEKANPGFRRVPSETSAEPTP